MYVQGAGVMHRIRPRPQNSGAPRRHNRHVLHTRTGDRPRCRHFGTAQSLRPHCAHDVQH